MDLVPCGRARVSRLSAPVEQAIQLLRGRRLSDAEFAAILEASCACREAARE